MEEKKNQAKMARLRNQGGEAPAGEFKESSFSIEFASRESLSCGQAVMEDIVGDEFLYPPQN